MKFAAEWTLSALLLVFCLSLFLLCATLILWDTGRPMFFTQTRVGQRGRHFRILKFRTMRKADGPLITASGDLRVTRSGHILRRWKLDELPQLWNVLRGEMSLVGPRPEMPEFVEFQSPEWKGILTVRPGITGAASLACRNEAELLSGAYDPAAYYRERLLPRKLLIELTYLRNCSFLEDVQLLLRTGVIPFARWFR